jgi:hypothetical protein
MSYRFRLIIAMIASAFGVAGLGAAIFGPAVYSYGTNWLTAGSVSLWTQGLNANSVVFLTVMLVAVYGISTGAYLRGNGDGTGPLIVLWVSVIVLMCGAAITLPGSTTAVVPSKLHSNGADSVGIGIYLVVPALAAFIAATVSTVSNRRIGRPIAVRSH